VFASAPCDIHAHIRELSREFALLLVVVSSRVVRFGLQYGFQFFHEFGDIDFVPVAQYTRCKRSLIEQHTVQKMLRADGGLTETLRQFETRLKH